MTRLSGMVLSGLVLAGGAIAPSVRAQTTYSGTIQLYCNPASAPYSDNVGGEFTAVTSGNFAQYYSPLATASIGGQTGFQTFCVQTGVYYTPVNWDGPTLDYTTGLASIGNTVDGNASPNQGNPYPDNYPLSAGTAYLYSQFAQGTLAGYDYTGPAATRVADAEKLQEAIWALQGGQDYVGFPSLTTTETSDPYYLAAKTALGANLDTPVTAANYSTYGDGVQILVLSYEGTIATTNNNDANQNQLVYTGLTPTPHINTPDNSTTLGLMALGLAGLAVFARKLGVSQSV